MRDDKKIYFTQRILPCSRRMYAAALAIMGSADDASDAVQTGMLRIWENIRDGKYPENPEGYCLLTVRNICISMLDRQRRELCLESNPAVSSTENPAEMKLQLSDVALGLRELTPNERKAIEMNAWGGCRPEEIAKVLGVTESNARQILSRGRRHLRKIFSK